jgi:hypothetical protein
MIPMGPPEPPIWTKHEEDEGSGRTGTPLTESERKALAGHVPILYRVVSIIIILWIILIILGNVFHFW